MAKLTAEQGERLEEELVSIFQHNPQESYQGALQLIKDRHADLRDLLVISDINYRVPKLRRSGRLPASQRVGRGGAKSAAASATAQHPVARAYQELDDAKRAVEEAQQRYAEAQTNLRVILKESLPQDFLETLVQEATG